MPATPPPPLDTGTLDDLAPLNHKARHDLHLNHPLSKLLDSGSVDYEPRLVVRGLVTPHAAEPGGLPDSPVSFQSVWQRGKVLT